MRHSFTNTRTFITGLLGTFILALLAMQPAAAQQSFRQSLDLQQMKFLQSEIRLGAGVLNLTTHNKPEADLQFLYTRESWKPEVSLEEGGRNRLSIRQPEIKNLNMKDGDRNEWDLKLPREMVGDLKIKMGAGEGNIDLKGSKLERLEMEAGAGDFNMSLASSTIQELKLNVGVGALKLDLTGKHSNNLNVRINGGIGDLKLQLPKDTGVRIKVSGLGGVDNFGLSKEDGYYVNEAYGHSPYTIEITVNGGLGSVEMALENGTY